ncbi:MAG: sigma-70 family RNA polymerase sigma factor [Candidatus Zixiibacteriota bacterium]|nr:MAG: sigma-70 family RNA polymerase sigma factor [candidate division Zixibacteria bacterium]
MTVPKTDHDLWREILSGDSDAWQLLVKRYQSLVYAVATRAGLSMADAADCFQQTWVALYENRHRIQDPTRLSAWLVTTAKREAMRLRRRALPDTGEGAEIDHPDRSPLPDEELIQIERQAHLEMALAELDPRCRQVVELFFFAPEEQSYDQIAESLGMTMNSLGPVRRRCLERLKEILRKNGVLSVRGDDPASL